MSMIQSDDDGYAIGGYTSSFGGFGLSDAWMVKTNAGGELEWSLAHGGRDHEAGISIIQTAEGGYALGGHTGSIQAVGRSFYLIRVDEEGELMWSRAYGEGNGRHHMNICRSILQTPDRGFLMAGETNVVGAGEWDFLLIRTDEEGDEIWSETYGGEASDNCTSMIETSDGGYALAGETESFGEGGDDYYLVKIDEDGEIEWSQTYGGEDDDFCKSVIQLPDEGFALAGYTRSFGEGDTDIYLVRTDAEGEELWSFTAGDDQEEWCQDVIMTDNGGYALIGNTNSFGEGGRDIWVIQTSPDPFNNEGEPPVIVVDPEFIEAEGSSEHVVNISNDGEGVLWWITINNTDWVTIDPQRGRVDPGGDTDFFVTINAQGLERGVYEEIFRVLSNDPEQREVEIEITLLVEEFEPRPILHVPDDFETIQEAIDAAEDGDRVLVEPGEYVENINFLGKEIIVMGDPEHPEDMVINGDRNGEVVAFENDESENTVLTGFTLTNGTGRNIGGFGNGGGVYLTHANPTITHCIIIDNEASWSGGGLECSSSSPTVSYCVIISNRAGREGGGVRCGGELAQPVFINCTFSENVTGGHQGGGAIYLYSGAHPELINCILWNGFRNDDPQEIWFYPQAERNQITISYSDIDGGRDGIAVNNNGAVNWGEGNIDEDPLFNDPDNGDFHLTADSPCIDTGDPEADQDPDGTRADMGALFFNQGGDGNGGETHFRFTDNTGGNHSLLVTAATLDDEPLPEDNEIGVFSPGGLCCGAGIWNGERLGFSAWMDDVDTEEVDGLQDDEEMSFRVWDNDAEMEYPAIPDFERGGAGFEVNGLSVFELNTLSIRDHILQLRESWNMISANVDPLEDDIIELMTPLVEADNLVLLKDSEGRFYAPAFNHNNIPRWESSEGYQLKTNQATQLSITGYPIPPDRPIDLERGWQIVAFYPDFPLNVRIAVEGIVDELLLLKNNLGEFYLPEFDFDNIGDVSPGQGYLFRMESEAELIYPAEQPDEADVRNIGRKVLTHYPPVKPTGNNMSMLLIGKPTLSGLEVVAVTETRLIVSSGRFDYMGAAGLAVWGDDSTTGEIDGCKAGEPLHLIAWDENLNLEFPIEISENSDNTKLVYTTDGFVKLDVSKVGVYTDDYFLSKAYPNPFNPTTNINFALAKSGQVELKLFDLNGRLVKEIINRSLAAGYHTVTMDSRNLAAGVYLYQLISMEFSDSHKLVLVK